MSNSDLRVKLTQSDDHRDSRVKRVGAPGDSSEDV